MANNENFEVQSRIEKGLKLSPAREEMPKRIANSIVPIFQSNIPLPVIRLVTDLTANQNNKLITVPENKTWKIKWIYCTFNTTATVGNRSLRFRVHNEGGLTILSILAITAQTASNAFIYNWAREFERLGTSEQYITLPDIILPAGFAIRIFETADIDDGDDLLIHLLVEEFDYSLK